MLKSGETSAGLEPSQNPGPWWRALSDDDTARLEQLERRFYAGQASQVGYPGNQLFDYAELERFFKHAGNNVGDPFARSTSESHTHDFECDVVLQFAELLGGMHHDIWGYVTSGGTEGNTYGLYLARELNTDGIVFFSEATHYSVPKIVRLLGARYVVIKSRDNGEIDYDDLHEMLRRHRGAPPIIVANIGTTMTGATDDVARIRDVLAQLGIRQSYIHCDAALSGMILPFVDSPPAFDFSAGIDSIAISGHKLIGAPFPCGVVLARQQHVDHIARSIEYVGTLDTTISGSRSALSPLFLWYAWRRIGHDGFRQLVARSLELADYAIERFATSGIRAWRNQHSITVVFPRPADPVLERWQIAVDGDVAHIITLPHVTEDMIDAVVEDCVTFASDA